MAAAGAGKTFGICEETRGLLKATNKRILLITYTNRGAESIKTEYCKQNMGVVDERVDIKTWYQFLLSEMIKPYQNFLLKQENLVRSIDFSSMYGGFNRNRRGTKRHYLNRHNDVLVNAASELAVDCNTKSDGRVINRLSKVYSHVFIDEVQDIAGTDLDLVGLLMDSTMHVTCVGDYKQATFKTHNTQKNKKVTGARILEYFIALEKQNIVTIDYQKKSRRFNQTICDFSNSIYADENEIETIVSEMKCDDGVYLIPKSAVDEYISHYNPTILKHDSRTDTLGFSSYNFGACKGMTYERVMIFPNKPLLSFLKTGKQLDSPSKYYVAATRAKYSIAFVVDKIFETDLFKFSELMVDDGRRVQVSKYEKPDVP